ncbi:hypothetical protein [Flagellimonas pelagia]|uniref:Lipocalin-like domain-containing protein n=1 Tax=Flagellimonas pelagia TaxID=2306998 RepID=A0A3A1NT33_9FLAO|nr:hypothetical protein [Allomuricauda maritima]RIV47538.1 hypothetical protein D2V05_00095 [Allomuricauda maritima]TXK01627.1 hypothetical protein FQ017_00090 [Allomuricauda maritima]
MKAHKIFFLLTVSISLFLSCSDDDGGSTTTEVDIYGTYDLQEVNVSAAVDVDGDGSSSTNLMDEADCISGTLIIRENMTWQFEQTNFTVTSITNNQYYVDCEGSSLGTGAWASDGVQIAFQGSTLLGTLQFSNDRITKTEGEDLPGIKSYVYVKRQ